MSDQLALTLGSSGFMPHGMCYLWQPGILSLHVIADSSIALAYLAISFTLYQFVRSRPDLVFHRIFLCFAVFIVACAATHALDVWVIWFADYWLSGTVKAITAVASIGTAALLIRAFPEALRIPSATQLKAAYQELETEVAQRRRTEEILRREEPRARLAALVNSSDDAIISKTPDGIIASWNRGAESMFGYSEAEAVGQPMTILFPPDRVSEEKEILTRIRRGQRVEHYETVRVRKDGTQLDVSVSISPIKDDAGTIVGASKIARDITARRRSENIINEQARILDLAPVLVRDTQDRIVRWSLGAERLYGFTQAEALDRVSHDLLRTTFPEPVERIRETLERTGTWEGELTHRRKDEKEIVVASVWALHRDAQGRPSRILESDNDVTERISAERRLAAQVARLGLMNVITRAISERQDLPSIFQVAIRTLEEQLPLDFACVLRDGSTDPSLTVAAIGLKSQALAAPLGLSENATVHFDLVGLGRSLQGQLVYEPDLGRLDLEFPKKLAAAGLASLVMAPLPVESRVFGVLIAGRKEANSFSSGDCEFLRQLSEHVALAAHQAEIYAALQTAYDDLRQTQNAVMQHERLRVLGQMASGIAHDINNALSPAALYTQSLLEHDTSLSEEARGYLVITQRAIDDVAQSVARMKEFYRPREPHSLKPGVNLNSAIEHVIELTRARWSAIPQQQGVVIHVETKLADKLPTIIGAANEIRDALTNLVLNAVDAMPTGGTITITSKSVAGNRVQVDVADTGVGMDEATRLRCLEPFFTTKGQRGSGLGLAMVYGMIERHAGDIQIVSCVGKGTTISLLLPVSSVPEAQAPNQESEPTAVMPLRVLLVDDDPILLKSLRVALERDHHSVIAADGGARGIEAFRAAAQAAQRFDVVITDLGMPHVDGRAVAAAVKQIDDAVTVILLTGWGHRMIEENDTPPHVDRVLSKPPKLVELRAALAELVRKQR